MQNILIQVMCMYSQENVDPVNRVRGTQRLKLGTSSDQARKGEILRAPHILNHVFIYHIDIFINMIINMKLKQIALYFALLTFLTANKNVKCLNSES